MKFGVNLMNFGPGAWPDSLTRWAMLTETLGYHFLMTSDHLAGDAYDIERARGPLPESAILALVGAYDAILCGDDASHARCYKNACRASRWWKAGGASGPPAGRARLGRPAPRAPSGQARPC